MAYGVCPFTKAALIDGVDPFCRPCRVPLDQLLGAEPEGNLFLRGLNGVGAVADVAADLEGGGGRHQDVLP